MKTSDVRVITWFSL